MYAGLSGRRAFYEYYTFAAAVKKGVKQTTMFDLFGDMEQKQKELQKKLAEILIEHGSDDGLIKVKIDGNKSIRDISIDQSLISTDNKEMLEDVLLVVVNEAIAQAEARAMQEMQSLLGDFLPDFKGLDSPFTA